MTEPRGRPAPVSFAALALGVTGAGVLVLGLTATAVALLPVPPLGRLVVAAAGLILTIVAMAAVSHHVTARAIRAEYGEAPPRPRAARSGAEGDEVSGGPDGLG